MSKFTAALSGYREAAAAFWLARSEQERKLLTVGAAVVGLALVYGLAIAPAVDGRAQLRKDLPQLRQQAAELEGLAREAAGLAAQAPVQPPPMTRDGLNAQLTARGLTPQSLATTGEYVKVEFKGVPFAALIGWLDTLRREQRIEVQDAVVSAQSTAGQVDATLTLHQGGGAGR